MRKEDLLIELVESVRARASQNPERERERATPTVKQYNENYL